MEADGGRERHAGLHLLRSEPQLVGATEVELIAIAFSLLAPQDGAALGQLDVGQTREGVHHLLLLPSDLLAVGEHLPLAAAAHAEMRTERSDALRTLAHEAHDATFHIRMLLAQHLHIGHIARNCVGHEEHFVVDARQSLAFGSHIGDFNSLQYLVFFLLSRHIILLFVQNYDFF